MKNLVMGVAKGYTWNDLEPFVISCRKNCPDADLVLFVDNISSFTEKKLNGGGVRLQPIPAYLNSKMIIDARWEMYKMFLEFHPEYEKIFVTDTRDVIFQGDLFSSYADKNFLVYAAEADLIKNDPANYNQTWIRHFFGEEEYQKLAEKNIICCGTVYGTRAEMLIVVDKMVEMLKRSTLWGDEQAAMNYLVYNKLLPIDNLIESNVHDGGILTIGLVKDFKVDAGKILRGDGKVPAAIHQYDRHRELNQLVDKIYREPDLQADGIFLDVWSTLDQINCFVQRQNFRMATKLFVDDILYAQNLKSYDGKFLKLYWMILQRYTPDAEILLSALQRVLAQVFAVNMNLQQLEELYRLFVLTEKNLHFANSAFKSFIKMALVSSIEIFFKNNRADLGKEYSKRLLEWRD